MAKIEEAIYSRLSTFSASSGVFSGRVYDLLLPQNPTYPCCSYNRVSSQRFQSHDAAVGMARSIFRINCWGSTYAHSTDGAEAVRKTWDGFFGTVASVQVSAALVGTQIDLFEEERNVRTYQTNVEVVFWHHEDAL